VYHNWKALESEHVSAAIHNWIDLIWGYKETGQIAVDVDNVFNSLLYENVWNFAYRSRQDLILEIEATLDSCGQIPQQLFTERHPPRLHAVPCRRLETAQFLFTGLGALKVLDLIGNVLLCQSDIELISIGVHLNSHSQPFVNARIWPVRLPPFNHIAQLSKRKACALLESDELAIISPTDIKASTVDLSGGLSGEDDLICLGTTGASITICKDLEGLHTLPSFRDQILCSAVSATFDFVVIGARKPALFIISPAHRTITRVFDLAIKNPKLVEFTKGWGFILVYPEEGETRERAIELFTVNGDFVRSVKIAFAI
jgi:hypothetical protein